LTVEVHKEPEEISFSTAAEPVIVAEATNYVLKQDTTHTDTKSTHTDKFTLVQQQQSQQHIPFKDIKAAAVQKMANKHEGVTYLDILKLIDNPSYTPKQAKDVLRNHKINGNLFTCNRTIPQQYYLSKADAEYSATRTTHFEPTGVNTFQRGPERSKRAARGYAPTPLESVLSYQQANALYDILQLFEGAPLSIHNLHLTFTMLDKGKESYDLLGLDFPGVTINQINKAKTLTRNISRYIRIRYNLYPSGKTELLISCSKSPFPIVSDHDVTALVGFLHQTQYQLSLNLHDTTNSFYVPPVHTWRLTEADINKDVPCEAFSMHIEPKLELKMLDTTLRLYVKLLGGQSVLRLEEMRCFNEAFFEAVASLRCRVVGV
jgi:hypothetical protein